MKLSAPATIIRMALAAHAKTMGVTYHGGLDCMAKDAEQALSDAGYEIVKRPIGPEVDG